MLLKRTAEGDLKTICLLYRKGRLRIVQIAQAMELTKAMVSVTIRKPMPDG
ncbi:MAG: hypothetical protein ACI4MG_01255 [Aristaeellaceae bacterium]